MGQRVLEEGCATVTWLAPGPEVHRPPRFAYCTPRHQRGSSVRHGTQQGLGREAGTGRPAAHQACLLWSLSGEVLLWVTAPIFVLFQELSPGLGSGLGPQGLKFGLSPAWVLGLLSCPMHTWSAMGICWSLGKDFSLVVPQPIRFSPSLHSLADLSLSIKPWLHHHLSQKTCPGHLPLPTLGYVPLLGLLLPAPHRASFFFF